ncbi:hypothetical protein [Pseudoalteromonas sp. A25]|uniref:hypothetical protein n=1 Tax=Pseudoalteromonas sp. A25 TaxID=116092 RepID=UPI0012611B9B|nr:hypothetical protein [Pseudoalteromonas sp. A25]
MGNFKKLMAVMALIGGIFLLDMTSSLVGSKDSVGFSIFVLILAGIPGGIMLYTSVKLYRSARRSEDIWLSENENDVSDELAREAVIQEKIREAVFAAEAKKQAELTKKESDQANLDALQLMTDLSREEIEQIAKKVRESQVD